MRGPLQLRQKEKMLPQRNQEHRSQRAVGAQNEHVRADYSVVDDRRHGRYVHQLRLLELVERDEQHEEEVHQRIDCTKLT